MFYNDQLYPSKIINLFPQKYIEEWMNNSEGIVYKKGEAITKLGQFENNVYLIKEGSVSVFHIHEDGKECIIGVLTSGEFINLFDVFQKKESSMLFKALMEVTVVAIKKEKIRNIVEQTPSLAMALLDHFSSRLQEMVEILSQIAYGKVEERLVFMFKKLANPIQEENGWCPLSYSITHQDIAGMVASTRETVTLLINKLIQIGVIRYHDERIWIQSKELNQD